MAELLIGDRPIRVVGMHLDLSGLWRRRQMRAILEPSSGAAENADRADGRHQRMADGGRLPQDLNGTSRSRRPARASTAAARSRRSTGSSSTRARSSKRPACTPARRARRPTICRSGRGSRASSRRDLALPAALDRRADAHRLAIFDDGPPGAVEARALQQSAIASSLRISVSASISLLIAALTASAAAPSPSPTARPSRRNISARTGRGRTADICSRSPG